MYKKNAVWSESEQVFLEHSTYRVQIQSKNGTENTGHKNVLLRLVHFIIGLANEI